MNSLSLQKRCRRGSLPFKKRPFSLVKATSVVVCNNEGHRRSGSGSCTDLVVDASPRKKQSMDSSITSPSSTMLSANPEQPPVLHTVVTSSSDIRSEDDAFAALALIATAAAAASASSSTVSNVSTRTSNTITSPSPSSYPPVSLLLPARSSLLATLPTRFSALTQGHNNHDDDEMCDDIMLPVVHVTDGQENAKQQSHTMCKKTVLADDAGASSSLSLTSSPPGSKKRIIQRAAAAQQEQQLQQNLNLASIKLPPPSSQSTTTTPLTSPLPGGCHGRTSRTHFYCRRRPCYKGSNYCKLHYQHYVLAANDANNGEAAAAAVEDSIIYQETLLGSSSSSTTICFPDEATEQQPMQNRRYTGRSCEQRCLATTTRGRPCAYVAASSQGGAKYCNLHADYDLNPSPRRGGTSISATAAAAVAASENHVQNNRKASKPINNSSNKPGVSTTSKTGCSRPSLAFRPSSSLVSITSSSTETVGGASLPSSTSSKPKSGKRDRSSEDATTPAAILGDSLGPKKRCTNAKLAKKHADSPFPLLSMFSTDQWMHKKVRISTGPLAGSLGKVEKWSNGWVSVRVPGVGLHNRRSFELYLVQQEQLGKSQEPSDKAETEADFVSDEQKRALLRCVSREAASPSPLTMTKSISTSSSSISIIKKTASGKSVATKNRQTTSGPTKIPQSPCPTRHVTDVLRTPVPQHVVTNLVPKVTPSLPKMPEKHVPLVQSLLLAQEGNGRMDLLFGTAALERSRRTVRKPTLYQDTEMLDKKQGSGRSHHGDAHQHIPFKKRVTVVHSSPIAEVAGKVDG